jgi:hypothetical protein
LERGIVGGGDEGWAQRVEGGGGFSAGGDPAAARDGDKAAEGFAVPDDLGRGRGDDLGVGIETEFGEREEAGFVANLLAEFDEPLGCEARHRAEFAVEQGREIIDDEAERRGRFGDAGAL